MNFNVLALGDVTGTSGFEKLKRELPSLKRRKEVSFTVANGENVSGLGLTPDQAEELFSSGVDVITLGNHTWGRREIISYLDDCPYILRPSNFAPQNPGRGWGEFDSAVGKICVINLIGRAGMPHDSENPFFMVDKILKKTDAKIVLVDFHAEMTSEKQAMAFYLDGRVSAVWGTHTHVQTSDICIMSNKTGYITDLGMTGPVVSVIGIKPDISISRFLGNPPERYEQAYGDGKIEGAIFEIDSTSGRCISVESLRIT